MRACTALRAFAGATPVPSTSMTELSQSVPAAAKTLAQLATSSAQTRDKSRPQAIHFLM